jgi:hypothetical protein
MTNHQNRNGNGRVREHLRGKDGAERVRFDRSEDAWHVYGRIPNTNAVGWWFAGCTPELLQEIALERGE